MMHLLSRPRRIPMGLPVLGFVLVLALFISIVPGCGGNGGGTSGSSTNDRAPNLLLVVVDTLRADHLDAYGYERPTMAVARRLAAEGTLFSNAFCQATWTGSSMTSMFTGVYPSTHGFLYNTVAGREANFVTDELTTLAEVLAENDYARIGHVTNLYLGEKFGFAQGFESYLEHPHLADADAVIDAAIRDLEGWRDHDSDRPLFLYVHFMEPHCPYDAPEKYGSLYQSSEKRPLPKSFKVPRHIDIGSRNVSDYVDSYDEEIHFVSDEIDRLLDKVNAMRLGNETLVVLTSDHGEGLFERGYFGHGRTFHDEVSRVPLIIRFPGKVPEGQTEDAVVQLVDLMPTLLDLLGLPAPEQVQGKSLAPLLQSDGAEWENVAYSELFIKGPSRVMMRSGEMKTVVDTAGKKMLSYYDLTRDPGETRDLAKTLPAARRDELVRHLVDWQTARQVQGKPYRTDKTKKLTPAELQRLKELGYLDE